MASRLGWVGRRGLSLLARNAGKNSFLECRNEAMRALTNNDGSPDNYPQETALEAIGGDGGAKIMESTAPDPKAHPTVLAVPLHAKPLLPGIVMPVRVSDEKVLSEIEELRKRGQPYVGAFLSRGGKEEHSEEDGGLWQQAQMAEAMQEEEDAADHLHDYGTFAQVHSFHRVQEGQAIVLLLGHRRAFKEKVESRDPLWVRIQHLRDDPYDESEMEVKAASQEIISTMKDLLRNNPVHREQVHYHAQSASDLTNPARLADLAASLSSEEGEQVQRVLEELNVPKRLELALYLIKREVELTKVQADISRRVEERMSKDQRKYFLHQQLKAIKRELGIEKDDKEAVAQRYRERFEPFRATAPQAVRTAIDEELNRLSALESNSAEFTVSRNYLDWLTAIPWGRHSEEQLDVERAREVLDEDHYGLDDVKERILEFIAVGKLRGGADGRIVCLVGPPGVGKTSLGKSVARAIGRTFHRFSVGGLSDASELKGNRRTYIGSMPGKFVQTLKSTQVCNPLIMVDEVDKLGRGIHGDPASVLLEALDPEQNASYLDHYMDVPIDLSHVLFLLTANTLDTIPDALLDRMEIIRLSGYLAEEKEAIARSYLEPKSKQNSGLETAQASVSDGALRALVDRYCRESGVRSLQKHLDKIYRKLALRVVRDDSGKSVSEQEPYEVSPDELPSLLGPAPFPPEELYADPPPGVACGLAWTSMGGSILHVECTTPEHGQAKGGLQATGQLGDVMKESTQIAFSFTRAYLRRARHNNPEPAQFFDENSVHLHVPAGATPKDGPSAGCTMIAALLSLALGVPVRGNLAMSGEVTLTGKILPVGGIKEKCIAAKRSGVDTIVLPEANRDHYNDLPDQVKRGIDVYFVQTFDDLFRIAFPSVQLAPEYPLEQDSDGEASVRSSPAGGHGGG